MALRGQNEIHTYLLQELKNDLMSEEFEDMKQACRSANYGGLGAGQLEKIKTIPKLLESLQHKRVFKEGSYQRLKDLLRSIGNNAAVESVERAEQALFKAGHYVEGYSPPGSLPMGGQEFFQGRPPPPDNNMKPPPYDGQGGYMASTPHPAGYGHVAHAPLMPSHRGAQNRSDAFPSLTHSNQYDAGPAPIQYHGPQSQHIPQTALNTNSNNFQRSDAYPSGTGLILFINNHFKEGSAAGSGHFAPREGAEVDHRTVISTCSTHLNRHKLIYKEEVDEKEFSKTLENTKVELRYGNYSSFILIVSSHGELTQNADGHNQEENIVLVDLSRVTLDKIKRHFSPVEVPQLVGKPKIFIIQACRGLELGKAVPDRSDCMAIDAPGNRNDEATLTRPDNADVLVAYSTSKGTRSWRNQDEGTWYINHLCRAIRENTTGDHFVDLLTSVQGQIAARETQGDPQNRAKQMPCFMSTLTKKFIL